MYPGAYYVVDRGYVHFLRLHRIHTAGAFFDTRFKAGIRREREWSEGDKRERSEAGAERFHGVRLRMTELAARGFVREGSQSSSWVTAGRAAGAAMGLALR